MTGDGQVEKGAEPTGAVRRSRGDGGSTSETARLEEGTGSQRGRNSLEKVVERPGRSAARELLHGPCRMSTTEIPLVLALVYAAIRS